MPDFEKLYYILFNCLTDVETHIKNCDYGTALKILISAQQAEEDFYISEERSSK